MKKSVSFLLISLCISSKLFAATGTMNFTGTVSTVCSFSNLNNGTLAVDPAQPNILSTNVAGGTAGSVTLNYIGTPTMSVEEVQGFATKPSGVNNGDFTYSTNVISNNGISYNANQGYLTATYSTGTSDTLQVGLVASKSAGSSVATGSYTASSILTCQ